mgnify:FL=1
MIRLSIGCGSRLVPGWLNVDPAPIPGAIRATADCLPCGDSSVECAVMFDVVEHLHPTRELPAALREVLRVLEPQGILRVTTPDLDKLVGAYRDDRWTLYEASQPLSFRKATRAEKFSMIAFGNHAETTPAGVYDGHQGLFDEAALVAALRAAGFKEVVRQRTRESLSETIRNTVADPWPATALIVEAVKW